MARARRAKNRGGHRGGRRVTTLNLSLPRNAVNRRLNFSRNRKILLLLLGFEILLVSMYALTTLWSALPLAIAKPLRDAFDLDAERNVPTIFSALQWFAVAVIWLQIQPLPDRKIPRWFMALTGAGFVFFAADEILQLHEQARHVLRAIDSKMLAWFFRASDRGCRCMWARDFCMCC